MKKFLNEEPGLYSNSNINFFNTINKFTDICDFYYRTYKNFLGRFYMSTKSNNWLKMHGYPMRRKDVGKSFDLNSIKEPGIYEYQENKIKKIGELKDEI